MRNEALDHDMESNSYKFIINLVLMKLSQKLKLYLTRSDRKKEKRLSSNCSKLGLIILSEVIQFNENKSVIFIVLVKISNTNYSCSSLQKNYINNTDSQLKRGFKA